MAEIEIRGVKSEWNGWRYRGFRFYDGEPGAPRILRRNEALNFSCDLWGIYIPATKTLLFAINLVCLTPWSYNLSWAKQTVQCWTAMSLTVYGQDCQLHRLRRLAQIRPAAARHGLALSALYGGAVRFLRGQSQQMSEESFKKKCPKREVWRFIIWMKSFGDFFPCFPALRSLPWCSHMSLWCGCSTAQTHNLSPVQMATWWINDRGLALANCLPGPLAVWKMREHFSNSLCQWRTR